MAQDNQDNTPVKQVNVWREDIVEEDSMLTQQEALGQAPSYQGYFLVPLVVDK